MKKLTEDEWYDLMVAFDDQFQAKYEIELNSVYEANKKDKYCDYDGIAFDAAWNTTKNTNYTTKTLEDYKNFIATVVGVELTND